MSGHAARVQVVIAGGGIAALEALLALRTLAGHVVEVTLLTPQREFLYRPVTVAEAFGRGEARSYDLGELVAGTVISDSVAEVLPDEHVVVTSSGDSLAYDRLVVAIGALARSSLPGALMFRGREDVAALREALEDLVARRARSIVFALPSERMWGLPLYELALMTASHLREHGAAQARVSLVTPEDEPLQLFGEEGARAIRSLLDQRGIELRCSLLPAAIEGRELVLAGSSRIYGDRFVTLPLPEGPRLPGLPHDAHGFIPVDTHGRVAGVEDVFAAGDITAFPLKQGGLAAQQADAVAEAIAQSVGVEIAPAPFTPVLRGLLLTGGAPLYLRCEPQRLPSSATVAIDARHRPRHSRAASAAAGQALWWPPAKVAGRYLAPYLAEARPSPLSAHLLADRGARAGAAISEEEQNDAVELALLLAECDARWGDYGSALAALDAAEALQGTLPAELQAKRREWTAARVTSNRAT